MPRNLLGLCLLLYWTACHPPPVLVVGIDSGDWDVIEPLVESGHLPNLGDIIESGARANLDCYPAMPSTACYCPPVWTSIATGQPYSVHGYSSALQRSSDRRVPAVWNVLAAFGGTTTLISMRGSWPPEPDVTYVMTEEGLDAGAHEVFDAWPPPRRKSSCAKPISPIAPVRQTSSNDSACCRIRMNAPPSGRRSGAIAWRWRACTGSRPKSSGPT